MDLHPLKKLTANLTSSDPKTCSNYTKIGVIEIHFALNTVFKSLEALGIIPNYLK